MLWSFVYLAVRNLAALSRSLPRIAWAGFPPATPDQPASASAAELGRRSIASSWRNTRISILLRATRPSQQPDEREPVKPETLLRWHRQLVALAAGRIRTALPGGRHSRVVAARTDRSSRRGEPKPLSSPTIP